MINLVSRKTKNNVIGGIRKYSKVRKEKYNITLVSEISLYFKLFCLVIYENM